MSKAAKQHLHFVQSIEPLQGGGLGRAAVELHHAFVASEAPSKLVTTYGRSPQLPDDPGVLELPRRGPDMLYYAPALRHRATELATDTDVLHAHAFYVATNWFLGRAARRLGKPLVYHAHGFLEPWILARSRMRKRLVHLLFEDANFRYARLWRALTNKEADQIRSQGVRAPIVVAPNGIHLEPFDAVNEAVSTSDFASKKRRRLLFLARLHPKKGLSLLIPAWARSVGDASDWELVVAGPDELDHRAEIENLVRQHRLEGSVTFTGAVTGADKVALLKSADAFILPSFSEGFSVAILEAMASRVPVAATHACNFPELASAGGWLCEPTLESVTQVVSKVVHCGETERRERGLAARRLVEQNYTWPSIARIILDACDQQC